MFVIPYNATVKTQNTKQDKHKKIARLFLRTHQILCSSASLQIKRNQFLKQFLSFPLPLPEAFRSENFALAMPWSLPPMPESERGSGGSQKDSEKFCSASSASRKSFPCLQC